MSPLSKRLPLVAAAAAILTLLTVPPNDALASHTPKLRAHSVSAGCPAPASGKVTCAALITKATRPARALAAGTAPPGLAPSALQDAYGFQSVTSGMRQTVAVVTAYDDATAEADLATFRSQYSIPACTTADGCFSKVNQNGGTSYPPAGAAGWSLATAENLDMISAMCPNCHILLVEANTTAIGDLGTAENEAVSLGARFVANTWFTPEATFGTNEPGYDTSYFDHPGAAITAPDGNGGGYGTYYPAASPDVVAVGGTTLTQASGTARGWTESAWSGSGAGCSPYEAKPSWQTDTGCTTRMLNDISADADPDPAANPVALYDTGSGGWVTGGGNDVAAAIVASAYALAGTPPASGSPASYLYASTSLINDITAGQDGTCSPAPSYFCTAAAGYDGPTGAGTPASPLPFTSGRAWPAGQIRSGLAGKCLDNYLGGTTSGNKVDLFDCNNLAASSQSWTVEADGTIRIAGLCLDNSHSGTANGNPVWAHSCNGTGAQQWRPRYPGEMENPGSGKCLDDPNSTMTNGTQLEIWTCNGGLNQQWTLPYPTPVSTGEITVGVSTSSATYCLDNFQGGTADGNKVDIYSCNGGTGSQEWTIEPDSTIRIQGKCLDNHGDSAADGNPIDLWACNGHDSQVWIPRSDGSLYNPETGKCLDDPHSTTTLGTQLDLWTCNGSSAQIWHLAS